MKIIEMLNKIKKTCERIGCKKCPFNNKTTGCELCSFPNTWGVKNIEERDIRNWISTNSMYTAYKLVTNENKDDNFLAYSDPDHDFKVGDIVINEDGFYCKIIKKYKTNTLPKAKIKALNK